MLDFIKFLIDSSSKFLETVLSSWGVVGIAPIGIFVINRIYSFIKKFFL